MDQLVFDFEFCERILNPKESGFISGRFCDPEALAGSILKLLEKCIGARCGVTGVPGYDGVTWILVTEIHILQAIKAWSVTSKVRKTSKQQASKACFFQEPQIQVDSNIKILMGGFKPTHNFYFSS